MSKHKLFIAWAFNRHCSALHNADFEVCQDNACVRACGHENAQHNAHLTGGESAVKMGFLTPEEDAAIKADNMPTHRR